jgi:Do/DeqQ family serine protease
VTNVHVIEGADQVKVSLSDKREFEAEIVLKDSRSDLAVLRLKDSHERFPTLDFANSDELMVGDVVLAIGNPFGVGQTVTMGIVSALGRNQLGINTFENFIQTDAAINPGNSGGALIDTSGNLIGINTAIYSRSGGSLGIGFAIPASSARSVMEQIVASGSVTRGWIGVEAQELTPELAKAFEARRSGGVLIAGVLRGGPADKAGFHPGDVLVSIDGRPVRDPSSMLNTVAALVPGRTAAVRLRRDEKDVDLQVEVGKRPTLPQRR